MSVLTEFENATTEEIAELTHEDIEKVIMYICANEGIKILPEPVEPEKPDIEPDLDAFELGEFACKDREPLDKIAQVISNMRSKLRKTDYNYEIGSDYQILKAIDEYRISTWTTVKPIKIYSQELYDSASNQLREYRREQKEYEELSRQYKKYKNEREDAVEWVWEKYNAAKSKIYERSCLVDRFEEYIRIADGNKTMALEFLRRAYSTSNEDIEYIKEYFLIKDETK